MLRRLLVAAALVAATLAVLPALPAAAHTDGTVGDTSNDPTYGTYSTHSHALSCPGYSAYTNTNPRTTTLCAEPYGAYGDQLGGRYHDDNTTKIIANRQTSGTAGIRLAPTGYNLCVRTQYPAGWGANTGVTHYTWVNGAGYGGTNQTIVASDSSDFAAPIWFWYVTHNAGSGSAGCAATDPGEPPPPDAVPAPLYACGRTMRDVGDGQWFADLEAVGPVNPPENEWDVDDHQGDFNQWTVSWAGGTVYGEQTIDGSNGSGANYLYKATTALPAVSTMPAGGWTATFTYRRELVGLDVGDGLDNTWEEVDVDHDNNSATAREERYLPIPMVMPWQVKWWAKLVEQTPSLNLDEDYIADLRYKYGPSLHFTDLGGGDWGDTGWKILTGRCTVLLDPSRDTLGGTSSSGPPGVDGNDGTNGIDGSDGQDGDPGTGNDDNCADRSLWAVLNPLNIARTLGCVLRALFIPDPDSIDGLMDGVTDTFPFDMITGFLGSLADIFVGTSTAISNNDGCVDVPVGTILNGARVGPALEHDYAGVNLRLPTPSDSGCGGITRGAHTATDGTVGNIYGYHDELRKLLLFTMWIGIAYTVVNAFTPGAKELEVGAP